MLKTMHNIHEGTDEVDGGTKAGELSGRRRQGSQVHYGGVFFDQQKPLAIIAYS